jgi:hypothetical protein
VKACIEWYPRFSAERKAVQRTQDESIKSFSFRLCAIQQTLKELGERLRYDPPKPVGDPANEQIELLTREIRELKIANQKYEAKITVHEVATEKLKFEIETQREKSRIMRNDLNFVLRQKHEIESQLCMQQDLVRKKNAECLSLRALLTDHNSAAFREFSGF